MSELLVTPEILHAVRGQSQGGRKVALRGGGAQRSAPSRGDIIYTSYSQDRIGGRDSEWPNKRHEKTTLLWYSHGESSVETGESWEEQTCPPEISKYLGLTIVITIMWLLYTLTLMGVGIFLYWFIFVLKYQGKMINLQIRIILTYVQFLPSEQKQKSSIPIYHWIATMLSLRFLNFYFYNRWNSLALVPFVALNRAKNIRPQAMSLDITNIWSAKSRCRQLRTIGWTML